MAVGRGNKDMDRAAEEAKREMRRTMVAQALMQGLNYRDMAVMPDIGVSISTISRDVKLLLDRWRREHVDEMDRWVTLQLRRLDLMVNALWNKAQNGDVQAIDRVMALMKMQAEFMGIDFVELSRETGRYKISQKAGVDPDSIEAWKMRDQKLADELRGIVDDFTDPDTGEFLGVDEIETELP